MATTNLFKAKINGISVTEEQLKEGLIVDYPSGMGGTIRCECVALNKEGAEFLPANKSLPKWLGFTVRFNQPDLSLADFQALEEALTAFSAFKKHPSTEDRALVVKAHELGYVNQSSYTQANWTPKGLERLEELASAQ